MDETASSLKQGFGTRVVHVGQEPTQWTNGEVIPPIVLSSTYYQTSPGHPKGPYDYSRGGNPTRTCLEKCLASLEGARYAAVFSSGLTATYSMVSALVKPGEHILCGEDCYGGTGRLFRRIVTNHGIDTDFCDGRSASEIVKHIIKGKTRLVWLESPTNPCLRLTDIEASSRAIKEVDPDIVICVDSTFMSSYLQQGLAFGADIVMHSMTKYMNGHSDLVMGAIMTNNEDLYEKIKFVQFAAGTIPGPFDCFLANRGLKTLHIRMEKHCTNALAVAQFLESHSKVEQVLYPGLKSHPQYELSVKQNPKGQSGMVSFYIKSTDPDAASKFCQKTDIFTLAESLGGVESLCEIPALMTHVSHPKEVRDSLGITEGLVRLSVGIEDPEDLINDLAQALDSLE